MTPTPTAVITGATRGLGRALADLLAERSWRLVLDGRDPALLRDLAGTHRDAIVIAGDVTDPNHRAKLAEAAGDGVDLLVNNAAALGPSPLPRLADLAPDALGALLRTNVVAPSALTQLLLPALRSRHGTVLNVSSDAAVEAYAGWGGYGVSKAALDQLSAVLAVEEPSLHVYAVDPGDMRTETHQRAFPGEDIGDRPPASDVAPALLRLLDARPPGGRYRAADWAAEVVR